MGGSEHLLVDRDQAAELSPGIGTDPDLSDRATKLASGAVVREAPVEHDHSVADRFERRDIGLAGGKAPEVIRHDSAAVSAAARRAPSLRSRP